MNKQEIFDKVLTHLRAQGVASTAPFGGCQYMVSGNGRKCAVGCLLTDADATRLEDADVGDVYGVRDAFQEIYTKLDPDGGHMQFLYALQCAHDNWMPRPEGGSMSHWEDRMGEIAAEYDLTYTPPGAQA